MTIAVIACLVLLLTVCWLGALVRARLAAEPAETMVRDIYDRYVTEVRTLTYAYLVQAAPAEEWLARIRSQVTVPVPARRPERRLPAPLAGTGGLLGLLVSPGDREPAALLPAACVAWSRLRYLWAPGANGTRMEPGPSGDLP
jgi:hypothetical protein